MKLTIAIATIAALAVETAVATTCTKSDLDFLTTATGITCTYRPSVLAPLSAINPSLSLTSLSGGLAGAQALIETSAYVLGICNAAVKVVASTSPVNCTDQVLNTDRWQAYLAVPAAAPYIQAVNGTRQIVIGNVTCLGIQATMAQLLPCFSKNCTGAALSFCQGNPSATFAATSVGSIAVAAFAGLNQACLGVLEATQASASAALAAGVLGSTGITSSSYQALYNTSDCTKLLNPALFGTFAYNTSAPTKPSSAAVASLGVATLASVVAAAFAF